MSRALTIANGATAVCAIHCAALPFLAASSAWFKFLHNPAVDGVLIGAAALVGIGTVGAGYLNHRRVLPVLLLAGGVVLLISVHTLAPHGWEAATSLAGAGLLIGAQRANRCPAPCCSQEHQEPHRPASEPAF